MVYLHIQKTGGTYFNRALIKDIEGYECQQHPEETQKFYRSICKHNYGLRSFSIYSSFEMNNFKISFFYFKMNELEEILTTHGYSVVIALAGNGYRMP